MQKNIEMSETFSCQKQILKIPLLKKIDISNGPLLCINDILWAKFKSYMLKTPSKSILCLLWSYKKHTVL